MFGDFGGWATSERIEECLYSIGAVLAHRSGDTFQFDYQGIVPFPIEFYGRQSGEETFTRAEIMIAKRPEDGRFNIQIREALKLSNNSFFKCFVRKDDPRWGDMLCMMMNLNLEVITAQHFVERVRLCLVEGLGLGGSISYDNRNGLSVAERAKLIDVINQRFAVLGDGTVYGSGGLNCVSLYNAEKEPFGINFLEMESEKKSGLRLSRLIDKQKKYSIRRINELNSIRKPPFRELTFLPMQSFGLAMAYSIPFWETVDEQQILDQIDWFLSLSHEAGEELASHGGGR